jgi:hypothetical protein
MKNLIKHLNKRRKFKLNKKFLSVTLAAGVALLATPFAVSVHGAHADGPQTQANASDQTFNASQIRISGAIENPGQPDPKDGILSGVDCSPDAHTFDKSAQNPFAHIVFAVQVTPEAKSDQAPSQKVINENTMVDVLIYGADGKLAETVNVPFSADHVDSNTGNSFFVRCVWLNNAGLAQAFGETLLPTGDYTYKFKATFTNPNGGHPIKHVRTWVPTNNTFTIFDSSQN